VFAFVFAAFELRFASRFEFAFEFVFALLLFPMLANTTIRITTPIPLNTSTAPIPRIHGQTLRFCGVIGGIGDHWGGGGVDGGGIDGGGCPGP
jgi:hypothetical protein